MKKWTGILFLLGSATAFAAPCDTKRDLLLDNSETKVWRSTICPNQQLPFHTHEHARVAIPAEDGTLKVIYQSGKTEVIQLKKNQPIFLDKAQGKEAHQDLNTTQNILHITVIELSKD
ncbi:hypothetical protein DIZ81_13095 [Legionella taurinensis]|uniref:Cupin domain-containing protein n=1 Tax=Legionella taurinensis TaxID=70611 RepID=A0A3A5L6V7_9GAMM|nr:hypothetical protein [Legionella taurinensis]MDX1836001.1 hypothetical protein [Legionella taurinensis]PUT38710.1 hypothetical protein DB744_13105 [Legionella taurinensis]PUT40089.1 hypothetical protein DB746_12505 [Legionella taurinensis]PUT42241.1 hypothetical protein DB743_12990 [Legionella taurinensis]PUT46013.1 hypothetical protein DB745_11960 [Legionella taurinensis]